MDKPRVELGRIWDGYAVEALIGEGANANVYLVQNVKRKTHFALKVLRRMDSRRRLRVEQEAVFRETLRHPNLVRAHHLIDVDGAAALVMDFVEGPTLARWLGNDINADLQERLKIFRGVVDGCRYAHDKGVVHRDLKPSNILLQPGPDKTWIPRISDFGLAKALAPEVGKFGGLTTVNTGLGTVGYAAPEQVRDASGVDHRADLYALGCILYEMVCGVGPFGGLSAFDTLQAQRDGRYRPPEEMAPELPAALYDLIRQMMSTKPDDRPADAYEVLRRLDAVSEALDSSALGPAAQEVERSLLLPVVAMCAMPMLALTVGGVVVFLARFTAD